MSSKTVTADPQSEPLNFGVQGLWAVFNGSPREQITFSFLASIVAYVATALSAGATAFLIVIFTITFLIGVVRLVYGWVRS